MSPMRQQVLLTSAVPETLRDVTAALSHDDTFASNGCLPAMDQLPAQLQSQHYPVVLVDLDPQPEEALVRLAPIIKRFPDSSFVVTSREMRAELVLSALRAGAKDFVAKAALGTELPGRLRNLSRPEEHERPGPGALVTVLSAGGGSGATTLAVNLANSLRLVTGQQTLLVDLDAAQGSAGAYLELEGQFSVANVLDKASVDPQLLLSTAVEYCSGLSVLMSPATVDFDSPLPLALAQLPRVVEACKRACPFTVVDAPRVSMDAAAGLAARSLVTLICLQLNVKDIRLTRAIVSALTSRGVPMDMIRPVVNRYQKRNRMVSFEDAVKALEPVPLMRLRNDFVAASRSMNYGKPLSEVSRRSKLHQDIHDLAHEIALHQAERIAPR